MTVMKYLSSTRLTLVFLVSCYFLIGCKGERTSVRDSGDEPDYYGKTSQEFDLKNLKKYHQEWSRAVRKLILIDDHVGGEISENPLALACAELVPEDFVYFTEMIFVRLENAEDQREKQFLSESLARLAGQYHFLKLPTWYDLINLGSLKHALAEELGAEAWEAGKANTESLLELFETKQEKVAFMVGHGKAQAGVDPQLAFDTYFDWGF
jgi:hypothetical protein